MELGARQTLRTWVVVVVGLTCAMWHMSARAEPFRAADTGWEGISQLLELARERLGRDRVELRAMLDYSELTAADGVLLLHPEGNVDYEQLSGFLRAGGRLAVIDDYGTGAKLLSRFRIYRTQAPVRPARTLRGNANLAIAVPSVEQVAGYEAGRHPIVQDVEQLVTNHPTALKHPSLTPVLEIPAQNEPDATIAVTGIIGKKGRLFAMSDPSVLINLMLRYPGNRAFADGLVQYLVDDDSWGARQGTLYILSGRFDERGQFGGETSLLSEIGSRLDDIAESLADMRETGLPELLALGLAIAAGLGAVAWTALVALRTYRRATPRYATGTPLVGQGGVAGRAAVLAAPTTNLALVLLELKSALEEGVAHRLGLDSGASHQRLLEEIDRQHALSQPSSEALRVMLADLNRVALAIAASQPLRVSAARVQRVRQQVATIIAELEQHKLREKIG